MKLKKRLAVIFLVLAIAISMLVFASCEQSSGESPVSDLVISTLPKTQYYLGDAFELGDAKLTATYEDGHTLNVPLDFTMISGFDSNVLGEQILTVRYSDVSVFLTVNVIEPPVVSIQIASTKHKKEYIIEEDFDDTDLTMLVTYSNGRSAILPVSADMVSGFNSSMPKEIQLVVSYGGKTCLMNVNILDKQIMQMQLEAPLKLEYIVGDTIDFAGGIIYVSYSDNSAEYLKLDELIEKQEANVVVANEDTTTLTHSQRTCSVEIFYSDRSFTYAITVAALKAESAAVTTDIPRQIMDSDEYNFDGGKITVIYNNGKEVELDFTDSEVVLDLTKCDLKSEGSYFMDITVSGATIKNYMMYVDRPNPETLKINVPGFDDPDTNVYKIYQGDTIKFQDWTYNIILNNGKYFYADGSSEWTIKEDMLIGDSFDSNRVGKQKIFFQVSVSGNKGVVQLDAFAEIEVLSKKIQSIEIINMGRTVYEEGDLFSVAGLSLVPTYNNGDIGASVPVTIEMLVDADGNSLDYNSLTQDVGVSGKTEKEIHVCYTDAIYNTSYIGSYSILLVRKTTGLSFITEPKTHYIYGEHFNFSELELLLTYGNGNSGTVTGDKLSGNEWKFEIINSFDNSLCSDFDEVGNYKIYLYYGGGNTNISWDCSVTNDIIDMKIDTMHIGFVTEGTIPEVSGISLTIQRENGNIEKDIPIGGDMVSLKKAPTYKHVGLTENDYTSAYFKANGIAALAANAWNEKMGEFYEKSGSEYSPATGVYDRNKDYYINLAENYSDVWNEVWFNFYTDRNGTKATKDYIPNQEYYLNNTFVIAVTYEGVTTSTYYTVAPKILTRIDMDGYKSEYVKEDTEWDISELEFSVSFNNDTLVTVSGTANGNNAVITKQGEDLFFTVNGLRYNFVFGIIESNNYVQYNLTNLVEKLEASGEKFCSQNILVQIEDAISKERIYSIEFQIYCYEEFIAEIQLVAGRLSGDEFIRYEDQTVYVNENKDLLVEGFVRNESNQKVLINEGLFVCLKNGEGGEKYLTLEEAGNNYSNFSLSGYNSVDVYQTIKCSYLNKVCYKSLQIRLNVISKINAASATGGSIYVVEKTNISSEDVVITISYYDADGEAIPEVKTIDLIQTTVIGYSKKDNIVFGSNGTKEMIIKFVYGGVESNEIDLTVTRKTLIGITMSALPVREYVENPNGLNDVKIDYTGGVVTMQFNNGTTDSLELSNDSIDKDPGEFNPNKDLSGGMQEAQTIRVSYTYYGVTCSTSYTVLIVDREYITIEYDASLGVDKKLTCEYGTGKDAMPNPVIYYYDSFAAQVPIAMTEGAANTVGCYYVSYFDSNNNEVVDASGNAVWPTQVGVYKVVYSYFPGTGDSYNNGFTNADDPITLEITKKKIAIVIEDYDFIYGDTILGTNDTAFVNVRNVRNELKWKMTAVTNGFAAGEAYCYEGENDETIIDSVVLRVYDKVTQQKLVLEEMTIAGVSKILINLDVGEYIIKPVITLKSGVNYELSELVGEAKAALKVSTRKVVIAAINASKVYGSYDPEYQFHVYNYQDVAEAFNNNLKGIDGADIIEKESVGLIPIGAKTTDINDIVINDAIYYVFDKVRYESGRIIADNLMYKDISVREYLLARDNADTENVGNNHYIYPGAASSMSNYEILYYGANLSITKAQLGVTGQDLQKYFGTLELFAEDDRGDLSLASQGLIFRESSINHTVNGDSFSELIGNHFGEGSIFYYNFVTNVYAQTIIGECDNWCYLFKNVIIKSDSGYVYSPVYHEFYVSGTQYIGNYVEFPVNASVGQYYVEVYIGDENDENALKLDNYTVEAETEVPGQNYSFTITIKKVNVVINVESFVATGLGIMKDQANGINGKVLASYFVGGNFGISYINRDTYVLNSLDNDFRTHRLNSIVYSIEKQKDYENKLGLSFRYRLSDQSLLDQVTFKISEKVSDAGASGSITKLNTGVYSVILENHGTDFETQLKSVYEIYYDEDDDKHQNPKERTYIELFYEAWASKYTNMKSVTMEEYTENAYIVVLPEYIDMYYGHEVYDAEGNIISFDHYEVYSKKLKNDFTLPIYYTLDGNQLNSYIENGISLSIVNNDLNYVTDSTINAGEYTGTIKFSYFDTPDKNYLYLGNMMVLESSAATQIINYVFDNQYKGNLTYANTFDYTIKKVGLSVEIVESDPVVYDNNNHFPYVKITEGALCGTDSLRNLLFDIDIDYYEQATGESLSKTEIEYSMSEVGDLNPVVDGTSIYKIINAGTYTLRVVDLGNINYEFNVYENGGIKSVSSQLQILPVDIPVYIKVDNTGLGTDFTVTYQASDKGINPVDSTWKKAAYTTDDYSYGTTNCFIVKQYYDRVGGNLLTSNVTFNPSNLVVSTADETGMYPKTVRRNADGDIIGYPINSRIKDTEYINYSVVFVYRQGNSYIEFSEGEGYTLIIEPRTVNLYGFGKINSKVYDGTDVSIKGNNAVLTITNDYQADKIDKSGLQFIFSRPAESATIGDYIYISDYDENRNRIVDSKNIKEVGTLTTKVRYIDKNGNENYRIIFADTAIRYNNDPETAIFNVTPVTISFDLKGINNDLLKRQYDGYGLTDPGTTAYTGIMTDLSSRTVVNQLSILGKMYYKLVVRKYAANKDNTPIDIRETSSTTKYKNSGNAEFNYNTGYYWYDLRGVFYNQDNMQYETFESYDSDFSNWLDWNYRYHILEPSMSTYNFYSCDGIYQISKRDVYLMVNARDDSEGYLDVSADAENVPQYSDSAYTYWITYNGYTYKANVSNGESGGKYYYDLQADLNNNTNNDMFKLGIYTYDVSLAKYKNIGTIANLCNDISAGMNDAFVLSTNEIQKNDGSTITATMQDSFMSNYANYNFVHKTISFRVRAVTLRFVLSLVDDFGKSVMTYGTEFANNDGLYFKIEYDTDYAFPLSATKYYDNNFAGCFADNPNYDDIINNIINKSMGEFVINSANGIEFSITYIGEYIAGVRQKAGVSVFTEKGVSYIKIGGTLLSTLTANNYYENGTPIPKYATGGSGLSSDTEKYKIEIVGTEFVVARREITVTGVRRDYFDKNTDNYTFSVEVEGLTEEQANFVLDEEDIRGEKLKDFIEDNTAIDDKVAQFIIFENGIVVERNSKYYVRISASLFKSVNPNYIVKTQINNNNFNISFADEWNGESVNNSHYIYLPLTIEKAKIIIDYDIVKDIAYGDIFNEKNNIEQEVEILYNNLVSLPSDNIYQYISHGETVEEVLSNRGQLLTEQSNLKEYVLKVFKVEDIKRKVAYSDVQSTSYIYSLSEYVSSTPQFDNFEIVWGDLIYMIVKKNVELTINAVETINNLTGFVALWPEKDTLYYYTEDSADSIKRLGYAVSISDFSLRGDVEKEINGESVTEFEMVPCVGLEKQIMEILGVQYDENRQIKYKNVTYDSFNAFMIGICTYNVYEKTTGDALATNGDTVRYIALKDLYSKNYSIKFNRTPIRLYPKMVGIGEYTNDEGKYVNLLSDTEASRKNLEVISDGDGYLLEGLSILVRYNFTGYNELKTIQYYDTQAPNYDITPYSGCGYSRKIQIKYIPEYSSLQNEGKFSVGDVIVVQVSIVEVFFDYAANQEYKIENPIESNYFFVSIKGEGNSATGYTQTEINKADASLMYVNDNSIENFGVFLDNQAGTYMLAENGQNVAYTGVYDIINLKAKLEATSAGTNSRKFEIILYQNSFGSVVLGFTDEKAYVRANYDHYFICATNNADTIVPGVQYYYFDEVTLPEDPESTPITGDVYEKYGNGFIRTTDAFYQGNKDYYLLNEYSGTTQLFLDELFVPYSEDVIGDNIVKLFDGSNHSFSIYIDKVGAFTNVSYVVNKTNQEVELFYGDEANNTYFCYAKEKTTTTTVSADKLMYIRVLVDNTTYLFTYIGEPYIYSKVDFERRYTMEYTDDDGVTYNEGDVRYKTKYSITENEFFVLPGAAGISYSNTKVLLSKFTLQDRLVKMAGQYSANVVFWPSGDDNSAPYVTNQGTAQSIISILSQTGNVTISGGENAMEGYKSFISSSSTTVDIAGNVYANLPTDPGLYTIMYENYYKNSSSNAIGIGNNSIRLYIVPEETSEVLKLNKKEVNSASPLSLSGSSVNLTQNLGSQLIGVKSLTYVFDELYIKPDSGLWIYWGISNSSFTNLTNFSSVSGQEVSGIALKIDRDQSNTTTARLIASRQNILSGIEDGVEVFESDQATWFGTAKEVDMSGEAVYILKIILTNKEDRLVGSANKVYIDDIRYLTYDDTIITFRLYKHTKTETKIIFEDAIKNNFGYEALTGVGISREEIENNFVKYGKANYAGITIEDATADGDPTSMRLLEMYTGYPTSLNSSFIEYSSLKPDSEEVDSGGLMATVYDPISGTYMAMDTLIRDDGDPNSEGGHIYMVTDQYDVPVAYTGNSLNIRFGVNGTLSTIPVGDVYFTQSGGFRYYFGMATPYYMSDNEGDMADQRGLVVEYSVKTTRENVLYGEETHEVMHMTETVTFWFYKYNFNFYIQDIKTYETEFDLTNGEEVKGTFYNNGIHMISLYIDFTQIETGKLAMSNPLLPNESYRMYAFIDNQYAAKLYVPISNDMSSVRQNDAQGSGQEDTEGFKDLLFLRGAYYMGFQARDNVTLSVYDCIGYNTEGRLNINS